MQMYSVFVGYSGSTQEEFQGTLEACKGYAFAMKTSVDFISALHIVELSPDNYWADDLEVMLDQELTPSMVEGYDDILIII